MVLCLATSARVKVGTSTSVFQFAFNSFFSGDGAIRKIWSDEVCPDEHSESEMAFYVSNLYLTVQDCMFMAIGIQH